MTLQRTGFSWSYTKVLLEFLSPTDFFCFSVELQRLRAMLIIGNVKTCIMVLFLTSHKPGILARVCTFTPTVHANIRSNGHHGRSQTVQHQDEFYTLLYWFQSGEMIINLQTNTVVPTDYLTLIILLLFYIELFPETAALRMFSQTNKKQSLLETFFSHGLMHICVCGSVIMLE